MAKSKQGHHSLVGQPHTDAEGPIAKAEAHAAQMRSDEQPLGLPGSRFDWRSPFFIGMTASTGVAVTYSAVRGLMSASSMLLLIAAVIPPLAQQAQFVDLAPHYIRQVQDHSCWIGRLNDRFGLQQRITDTVNGVGGSAVGQVVKAGSARPA